MTQRHLQSAARVRHSAVWLLMLSAVALSNTVGCEGCAPVATDDGGVVLGDGFESVTASDDQTITLTLSRDADPISVDTDGFGLTRFTVLPPEVVAILAVSLPSSREIVIDTGALVPGETYTLAVDIVDVDGVPISGTLNVKAAAAGIPVDVRFLAANDAIAATWTDLSLLVSTDDVSGVFSERMALFPLVVDGNQLIATVSVVPDAARTITTFDDGDPRVDRRAYAARIVDGAGRMASPLVRFLVRDDVVNDVQIPLSPAPEVVTPILPDVLPDPPVDENVGDGKRVVRILVDDRIAHEMSGASLKLSFTVDGTFDATFPQTIPLTEMTGEFEGFFEAVVELAVDPARIVDGTTLETFPYIAYLVVDGLEYEGLSANMTAVDEITGNAQIFLGNAAWTPVTFRVDAQNAFVNATGTIRGHHPGEAVFLTGEWQTAVDALGNNCGDGFSGGEQRNLKMREVDGHPGVWSRTLWLPPGRPYGWKSARCDADDGCGPLNQLVASSGRAFATVMKNLVTDNVDAFADPDVGLVDPNNLSSVTAAGTVIDYTDAVVHIGDGNGGEPDPAGTPDGVRMFKQEVPDLVVVVGDTPVTTRVFVVGTWRDVNLGQTPEEIIATSAVVELNPFDYDDGFVGRYPPSRENP